MPLSRGLRDDFAHFFFAFQEKKKLMRDIYAAHFQPLSAWLPLCPRITRARPWQPFSAKDTFPIPSTTSRLSEVTPQTLSTIPRCSTLGFFGFHEK